MHFPPSRPRAASQTRWAELFAGLAIAAMSVPQGVAYALIAGLPPAMGLYAGMLPAIVSSLTRGSRHVIAGPTNAISLLFATSVAAQLPDPVAAATTMALLVGLMQLLGGVLNLKALVDYVSTAVVTGYITGAAVLIAVAQLPLLSGTEGGGGDIFTKIVVWAGGLRGLQWTNAALGVGVFAWIVVARRRLPKGSAELLAIVLSLPATMVFGLPVSTIADIGSVPATLPKLALPAWENVGLLLPAAGAAAVLSMVEGTAVARDIASRTGDRVDLTREFLGQGAANLAAAVTGAYPVSGSLSRSVLNERMGGGRLSGVVGAVATMFVVLVAAPLLDRVPLAALAGLLLVVAMDLIDPKRIRRILASRPSDWVAYIATVLGTWVLPLDQAIYLGVGISVVLFLRRARHLVVRELTVDHDLRLHECDIDAPCDDKARCDVIRILHIEGPLFFGAANELEQVLADVIDDPKVRTLILRLKRARDLDFTAADVLASAHRKMADEGRELMLVGMREEMMRRMEDIGVVDIVGEEHLYPTQAGWFAAMNEAIKRALDTACEGGGPCERCPLRHYVQHREEVERAAR